MIYRRLLVLRATRWENVIARGRRRSDENSGCHLCRPRLFFGSASIADYNKTPFIDIRQLYRWRVENAISGWKKDRSFWLSDCPVHWKRRNWILSEGINAWTNEFVSEIFDQSEKIFMSHVPFVIQYVPELSRLFTLEFLLTNSSRARFQKFVQFSSILL